MLTPIILVREKSRSCDGCDFKGEVFLIGIGRFNVRLCNSCMCRLERMRMRIHVEALDSLETR